jgi:hypothetical protein
MVILVVGYYRDLVEDLLRAHPLHRVMIVEEADLIASIGPDLLADPRASDGRSLPPPAAAYAAGFTGSVPCVPRAGDGRPAMVRARALRRSG